MSSNPRTVCLLLHVRLSDSSTYIWLEIQRALQLLVGVSHIEF
jgi:hypothetical protein